MKPSKSECEKVTEKTIWENGRKMDETHEITDISKIVNCTKNERNPSCLLWEDHKSAAENATLLWCAGHGNRVLEAVLRFL